MTRRDLLAGAAGVGLAASLPAQTNQRASTRPILGEKAHTYEAYHDWLVPPKNLAWGDTHGVTTDKNGFIYIAHTVGSNSISRDTICVFDPKGKFVKSFGSEWAGGAHGLDLRKEGREEFLYICDVNRKVVAKADLNGRVIWELDYPKESGKYRNRDGWNPTNVAFLPAGNILVGDGYGSSFIHEYTKDGAYVRTIIGPGNGAGQVSCPHGLWVDQRIPGQAQLVVADRGNRRLQMFDLDGKHKGFVTEGVRMPCHIHFNSGLMLIPDLESRITILGVDNKPVAQLGDGHPTTLRGKAKDQFQPGKFVHPHGAAWINKTDIVVAEWVPQGRITLLKRV